MRNSVVMLGRATILLAVVACLAIVLACGDDDDEAVTTPTDVPTSNGDKGGPLSLSLVEEPQPHLTWVSEEEASSYQVTGTLEYGPTCEAQDDGVTDFETVTMDETLDATETEFTLPLPEDERLGLLVEAQITIETDTGVQDGVAYTGDPICE